jgi:hypothetical protein
MPSVYPNAKKSLVGIHSCSTSRSPVESPSALTGPNHGICFFHKGDRFRFLRGGCRIDRPLGTRCYDSGLAVTAKSPLRDRMTVQIQLRTMDHSARRSMKNAANCVKYGELQGSRNRNVSNAYGTLSSSCWGYVCLRVCWTDNDHLVSPFLSFETGSRLGIHQALHGAGCFPFDIRCLKRESADAFLVPPMSEIRYRVPAGARGPGVMGLSIAEYKST